jgi:hypothetical protein
MFMPKDASTPQMFENRNGLSSVTTASVQMPSFAFERSVNSSGLISRPAHVAVNRLAREQLQIALRQPLEKGRDFGR